MKHVHIPERRASEDLEELILRDAAVAVGIDQPKGRLHLLRAMTSILLPLLAMAPLGAGVGKWRQPFRAQELL